MGGKMRRLIDLVLFVLLTASALLADCIDKITGWMRLRSLSTSRAGYLSTKQ